MESGIAVEGEISNKSRAWNIEYLEKETILKTSACTLYTHCTRASVLEIVSRGVACGKRCMQLQLQLKNDIMET